MRRLTRWRRAAVGAAAITIALAPLQNRAQSGSKRVASRDTVSARPEVRERIPHTISSPDSVVVVANGRYDAGDVHRFLLGDTYRDLWELPIKVPVLDLTRFAGGLRATEEGGGNQTKSLRFQSADGRTWVFRPVSKDRLAVIERWRDTPIMDLFRDGQSGSFPAAPVVTPPFLQAIGIPHPVPLLAVMPDDERLGEFREKFAGRLGTIEEHVSDAEGDPGFGGAVEILDSEELLERINKEPKRHVDARKFLQARLVDIMLGDTDRHRDQWKWAQMSPGDSLLTPIPRDRDRVLATHDGLLLKAARLMKPYLVEFDSTYPRVASMVGFARDLDDRLVAELDWKTWDSAVTVVQRAVTDSVIHAALYALPRGYHPHLAILEGKLRSRRDRLGDAAADYYRSLSEISDVHGTDHADNAHVVRNPDGTVLIQLGGATAPWFSRRFDPRETKEIRLFLHGGDDTAAVSGTAGPGIVVRVVGGGGTNQLADSSQATGSRPLTRLYDRAKGKEEKFEPDSGFNRLPWVSVHGTYVPPNKDWGTKTSPVVFIGSGRGLGVVPRLGAKRYRYGFRRWPYKSMIGIQGEYASSTSGYRALVQSDFRFEDSPLHLGGQAEMSEFEIMQFFGLGNDVPYSRHPFFDVDQRQWMLRPVVAYAFGLNRDVSIGPVMKFATSDSTPDRFISEQRPYGFGRFGQVGLELRLKHDTRDNASNPLHGFYMEAVGSTWPKAWSLTSAFHRVGATASTYLPMPGPKNTVLALRAGGEKIFGEFPYYESAFIGGSRTLRSARYHRFAGDASLFGTSELRVPVARVPLILPWDVGLLGFAETGRVFVDGRSPGGWHSAVGGGFWIGVLGPSTGVSVLFTNARERGLILGTGVSF
ncbi:MAG: BamA/TamA family outer membrane protein [Gemmatimonadaceae bacterium]